MKIKQRIKFGNTDEDIDLLALKVLSGSKIATSSLLEYYRLGLKSLSTVDDYMAILDSSDNQVAVVRVVRIEIMKFGDIPESFAVEEGDGSLANWKMIHRYYYSGQLSAIGKELTNDTELVCEWFRIVPLPN